MYQYDEIDRAVLDARTAEFREQVHARLSGALSEDEFKPLRLMNGVSRLLLCLNTVSHHANASLHLHCSSPAPASVELKSLSHMPRAQR